MAKPTTKLPEPALIRASSLLHPTKRQARRVMALLWRTLRNGDVISFSVSANRQTELVPPWTDER
jgi:hypothetical protein